MCPAICITEYALQDEEVEDDEFYTAHNTMVERHHRKKDGTIVSAVDTITDLGTLVIIDDPGEEDEMDTMKSGCGFSGKPSPLMLSIFPV